MKKLNILALGLVTCKFNKLSHYTMSAYAVVLGRTTSYLLQLSPQLHKDVAGMDYAGFYNGRPCKACVSVEDMMKMGKNIAAKKAGGGSGSSGDPKPAGSSSSAADVNNNSTPRRKDCPVDKDELGRSTWNLLHTMAAYYPDKPTKEEKSDMKDTLTSLSKVCMVLNEDIILHCSFQTYPCPHCAEDFRKDLKQNPPKLENRETLSQWMCEMHNRVNVKLGKERFDCTKVFERWYDGWKDGSCGY